MKRKIFLICLSLICCFSVIAFAQEMKSLELPKPNLSKDVSLRTALEKRQSIRSFDSERDLSLSMLSNLLWAARGINRPEAGLLTAPTANNRREIDVYVAMKNGLYLYDAKANLLKPILKDDIREFTGIQQITQQAPVNLIYVADYDKMTSSLDEKRITSATDTGFISQNVYLFCASENLATVVLGWVDKEALAKKMGLQENQKIILTQPVGYPK